MTITEIAVKADVSEIENLIDQLKDLQTYKLHEGAEQPLVDLDDVVKIFADHVEAEAAQPEPQWIPCSERLPNSNGNYNVTRKISDGFECRNIVDTCYFDETNIWHDDTRVNHDREYLTDIVAWRELPEPWRGEEQ